MKKLYRSKNAMVAGVCAGLAEYLGLDKTVIRVVVALATLFTGGILGIIAYAICAFIIPQDDDIIDN